MPRSLSASPDPTADLALRVANSVPAMLAYWKADQTCLFANEAYRAWSARNGAAHPRRTGRDPAGVRAHDPAP